MGRIIQKLFPSSVSKKERSKDDWSKKIRVFHGISFKGQTESVNFEDISQLCANSFLIEKNFRSYNNGALYWLCNEWKQSGGRKSV